jgi:hypothetical protein
MWAGKLRGEQQMLATGRALMQEPRLIMFDEPSLGLSPILVQEIFTIIKELHMQGAHRFPRGDERQSDAEPKFMKKIPKNGRIWDFWNFRLWEYRMLRRWRVEKVVCSARK